MHTEHENLFSVSLVSEHKQAREKMQFMAVEVFADLFTVFIFNYKAPFVCVKGKACRKIAIPAYCFNIFGSMFGDLFCLHIKKLIL